MTLTKVLLLTITLFASNAVWAQCAPGIPSAGNPGCIPPTQPGSPYGQQGDANSFSSSSPPPAARWAERWGAVALDASTGSAGVSTGMKTQAEAKREALDQCRENRGQACAISVAYRNQCAAVAQRSTGGVMGSASGPTLEVAKAAAKEECGDTASCQIVYSACSLAERVD